MHFDFTVTLGQLLVALPIITLLWRIDRIMARYLYEHELLMVDYCERQGIDITSLPTRTKR